MTTIQAPAAVVMIRPHNFQSNPETRFDNAFQTPDTATNVAQRALEEFDTATSCLRKAGVQVHVFDDFGERETPDSVFPNNWFSTHTGGHVALYPMHVENRRRERRTDVIDMLKQDYRVSDVVDYSGLEQDGLALEGTGAMVLDHIGRIAYVARSDRANPIILERFCTHFNYEPLCFDATDQQGRAIYHTNVLMGIGTEFALICLDMIKDLDRRRTILDRLSESGRTVIDLSAEQIASFAGNAIELTGNKRVLALSARALDALRPDQISIIERTAIPLPLNIPTIETAGGSVRCMIAGIHLTRRPKRTAA
ncbi:amidinotransferase [Phaeobacter gallaeciensis]|uniref:Amidinotransferase n=2 Tax=Roseobacteraceae TaxID=2854170 RepID=A0A366XA93_9RHOB|nr:MULTISPECIES: arginine deiminase-related protein [Roseobacteraceae]MBT3140487.1 amidinotransferase [Falsiruegeria litorea]MBT8169682.1 amidinotransferase [Falsiruegeria litorea]RBW62216.1 amidinotransferase [Phaeobacter gallaeciensis]